jgi:adenosylcobinamide-GDP ribazoletransferase
MIYRGIGECLHDLKIGAMFLTRLPFAQGKPIEQGEVARALWAAPLVGAAVGALGAAVYALGQALQLPALPAATLAIAATAAATGLLHEDGLADTADGIGGGTTREGKLAIMRDSRIGTYGTSALLLSFLIRAGALASLGAASFAASALISAGAAARADLASFMALVPAARADGMSVHAGVPPAASALVAALLGLVALFAALGAKFGTIALVCLLARFAFLAWLCRKQIGGQTGDVLGALEQTGEIAVLLVASAAAS